MLKYINLRIALVISLGVHIFFMCLFKVVIPGYDKDQTVYTKIDFLGPLFKTTAFDILAEGTTFQTSNIYEESFEDMFSGDFLKAEPLGKQTFYSPDTGSFNEDLVKSFDSLVSVKKAIPEDLLAEINIPYVIEKKAATRKVISKSANPFIDDEFFLERFPEGVGIKVKVYVASSGIVNKVEPLSTSSFPEVDMVLIDYVSSWTFEPSVLTNKDEDIVIFKVEGRYSNDNN